jgi:hypothetical protein
MQGASTGGMYHGTGRGGGNEDKKESNGTASLRVVPAPEEEVEETEGEDNIWVHVTTPKFQTPWLRQLLPSSSARPRHLIFQAA